MNFEKLVLRIQETNNFLQQNAVKAVNTHLTIRNWLTGFYIVEFEQNGNDRAKYGTKLLETISKNINIKGLTSPELSRCRQFYKFYPQIFGLITQEFKNMLPSNFLKENVEKSILGSATQELPNKGIKHISTIFQNISYTHFTELIKIEDSTKRRFYELLILKTQPTPRKSKCAKFSPLTNNDIGNYNNYLRNLTNKLWH